jgi:hypothetical protein
MKYLIPVDSTPASLEPIGHLERMARCGLRVEAVLLNVQPRLHRHIAQFTRHKDRDAWRRERSLAAMAPAAERLAAAGIPYRMIADTGTRVERIAAVAAAERVDDILRGEKRGPVDRYLVPAGLAGLAALLLAAD